MKDGPNFCEKGARTDIVFYSKLTYGKKMKDFIVYGHVLDKNLLRFFQIHLQLAVTAPARSAL
jgi:hypothetical protein